MILTLFTVLVGIASVFLLSGAIRKDEHLLATSGTIFLILGGSLIVSGLQIQTGTNIVEEDTGTNTTEITENPTYENLDTSTGLEFSTEGFSIVFLVTGLYLAVYSIILGDGKPRLFRNFLRR